MSKWILLGIALMSASSAFSQEIVPVCERSEYMREMLVSFVGKPCDLIRDVDLAQLSSHLGRWSINGDGLKPGDFTGLSAVRELSVAGSGISELPPGVFRGLTRLKRLVLGSSRISGFAAEVFSDTPDLEHLEINGWEELEELQPGMFSELRNLHTLFLLNNRIRSVENEDFTGLESLLTLSISGNQLTAIEPDDFSAMPQLLSLIISANPIREINPEDFSLLRLTRLDMANIPAAISKETFRYLPDLVSLGIDGHTFSTLPMDLFTYVRKIRNLSVGSQHLEEIPDGFFLSLPDLKFLDVTDSPLTRTSGAAFQGVVDVFGLSPRFGSDLEERAWAP